MPHIMELIQKDLSEPYSVYTYRYFINNWGNLCFLAYHEDECVGAIVCKLDARESRDLRLQSIPTTSSTSVPALTYKGYIAMLVVKKEYRKLKIGSNLVKLAVNAMRESGADEVVLETEVPNKPALKLYENLGFLRDKRLYRYYLNGLDALRLKLWIDTTKKVEQEAIIKALASVKVDSTGALNS